MASHIEDEGGGRAPAEQVRVGRAQVGARSRSRGRTPSELLARKQQLLGAADLKMAPPSAAAGDAGQDMASLSSFASQSAAELRLVSLSEMLKNHHNGGDGAAQDEQHANGGQQQQQQQQDQSAASLTITKSIDDVYILLAKKEKDLQLAAELGKVLLERNDELSKANERIAEEYSRKLELLEQDKHKLRRKLDLLDGEYENRIIELQTDCNVLKNQLEQEQQVARRREKEKSKLIDDLVQQSQRLTAELAEATKSEEVLSSQLEQVNKRMSARLSSRQDHVAQVDALQDEIKILNQRKQDLERRLKLAQSDKVELGAALDESGDKLVLLESLLNEKDSKLGELALEANELRDTSAWLSGKLESMISLNERLVSRAGGDTRTAAAAADDLNALSERERSQLVEQLKELRVKSRSRAKANELILQEAAAAAAKRHRNGRQLTSAKDRRRQATNSNLSDEFLASSASSSSRSGGFSAADDEEDDDDDGDDDESDADCSLGDGRDNADNAQNKGANRRGRLLCEAYALLRNFHDALQQRKDALQAGAHSSLAAAAAAEQQPQRHLASSNDDSGISADEVVEKRPVEAARWRQLLGSLKLLIEEMPCTSCQLMIGERVNFERLQKLHAKLDEELRRKNDQVLKLSAQTIEQEAKLESLNEKCSLLKSDLENCDKPAEKIVQLAWKARDEAVARKNQAEISLAKTRIENMQVSSQLMEVVQQKGELSQKLAQFEDDIHHIMQHSVKAKFTCEEYANGLRKSKAGRRNGSPTSGSNGYNSIVQLLNFSLVSPTGRRPTQRQQPSKQQEDDSTTQTDSSKQDGFKLAAKLERNGNSGRSLDSSTGDLAQAGSTLFANFSTNKLKFWQRN